MEEREIEGLTILEICCGRPMRKTVEQYGVVERMKGGRLIKKTEARNLLLRDSIRQIQRWSCRESSVVSVE